MTEREEIRWKFQILIQSIDSTIVSLEEERNAIKERYTQYENHMEKLRTKWIAVLGAIATILSPFIIIGKLDLTYSFIVIGALGIILIIWVKTNLGIQNRLNQFLDVDNKYFSSMKEDFLPIKDLLSTLALVEKLTENEMKLIIKYISVNQYALSYSLTNYLKERLPNVKFNHEDFRDYYELSKTYLNEFKDFKTKLDIKKIENFIQEFEKNEK